MSEIVKYTVGATELQFDVVDTEDFRCEDEWDARGNQVLMKVYARWRLTLNPATLGSYRIQGGRIKSDLGNMPATTLDAIEWHMNAPRGTLSWTVGDVEQLRSPAVDASVDAANGPIPHVVSIVKLHGIRTWEVVWEVTTYLNRANRFDNQGDRPLISHTWSTTETLSRCLGYRSVRVTQGEAIFDTSKLNLTDASIWNPDNYRLHLLPVCPRGFAREDVTVTADESGAILRYTCVDHEMMLGMKAADVVYADCQHTCDVNVPSLVDILVNSLTLGGTLQSISDSGDASAERALQQNSRSKGGRTYHPQGTASRRLAATSAITKTIVTSLPQVNWQITANVKGTRKVGSVYLLDKARKIINHRQRSVLDGLVGGVRAHYNQHWHMGYKPDENLVSMSVSFRGAVLLDQPFEHYMNLLGAAGDDLAPDVAERVPVNQSLHPLTRASDVGSNLPPKQDSRGYAVAAVVAQQLTSANAKPDAPALRIAGPATPADPHA